MYNIEEFVKNVIQSIVATLSIKRSAGSDIIKETQRLTNNTITKHFLFYVREQIKKESAKGLRISVHVYTNNRNTAIMEAFTTYQLTRKMSR